jgi:hypothetical protein
VLLIHSLNVSRYGPKKRREFTAEVSSKIALGRLGGGASAALPQQRPAASQSLTPAILELSSQKRGRSRRYGPANQLEFTAGVSFNFAQVRLAWRVSAGTATSSPRVFLPSHQSPLSQKIATPPQK